MSDVRLMFFDQFYLGIKDRKPLDVNDPTLGFLTQYGEDKAFATRRKTVDDWVGNPGKWVDDPGGKTDRYGHVIRNWEPEFPGPYEGQILANSPQSGFSFDRVVSRWTTSNKWFRVNDPRGFQLEISSENLADLLLNCHISNGVLEEPAFWAKNGQKVWLCRPNHPEYILHQKPKVKRSELVVGDVCRIGRMPNVYQYVGALHAFWFDPRYAYQCNGLYSQNRPHRPYSYSYYGKQPEQDWTEEIFAVYKYGSPVRIFRELENPKNYYYVGDSAVKITIAYHEKDKTLPLDIEIGKPYKIQYGQESGCPAHGAVFFKSREDMLNSVDPSKVPTFLDATEDSRYPWRKSYRDKIAWNNQILEMDAFKKLMRESI